MTEKLYRQYQSAQVQLSRLGNLRSSILLHLCKDSRTPKSYSRSKYSSGFFRNPPKYLADKGGEHYRSGALEPEFQRITGKGTDRDNMPSRLHWALADEPNAREAAAHVAVKKIAHSSLKRVGIIWGSEGTPACLLGSWLLEMWLLEAGAKEKVKTKQVEGGNHLTHYYRPREFWEVVLELSG